MQQKNPLAPLYKLILTHKSACWTQGISRDKRFIKNPKSETMTKIRISNDQNEFFRVVCFEFGTFEIWICFEFRASIFEFPSLEIQTAKEPLSPAPQFMT